MDQEQCQIVSAVITESDLIEDLNEGKESIHEE